MFSNAPEGRLGGVVDKDTIVSISSHPKYPMLVTELPKIRTFIFFEFVPKLMPFLPIYNVSKGQTFNPVGELKYRSLSPSSNVKDFNPVQLEKALLPMLVTELEMVIDVNPEQSEKAPFSIDIKQLGVVTAVNLEQPRKA